MEEKTTQNINLYWICQWMGWGSVALYWSYYQMGNSDYLWLDILGVIVPFMIGIGSTHLYKIFAHRWKWIRLDLNQLIPRVLIILCALTAIYVLVGYYSVMLRTGYYDTTIFLGMFTGGLRYMAIWLLAFHLYHYAGFRRQAEIDQSKSEQLAIAAQFNQLNTELNPHFLFNALNSIKALTIENPKGARRAVDLLSDLLRNTLQISNKRLIPLSAEIQRIESYLALEKIRFEERLNYSISIALPTKNQKIPPLCLYNLVENAVKHGVNKSKQECLIEISTFISANKLHLQVINGGFLDSNHSLGLGLKNSLERMELIYGPPIELALKQITPHKVKALIILPI